MDAQVLMERFIEYLRSNRGLSEHTCMAYRGDILQCLEALDAFGRGNPDDVTLDDLRMWMGRMAHTVGKTSLARKTIAVRSFFTWAYEHGMLAHNPAHALRTPKIDRNLPAVLNEDKAERLMDTVDAEAGEKNAGKSKDDALNAHAKALRDCAMLELLYATGMRVGELVGLDMGSFDWSNRTVRVLGKGNKTRVIPFGAPAQQAVEHWLHGEGRYSRMGTAATRCSLVYVGAASTSVWCVRWCMSRPSRRGCLTSRRMRCAIPPPPICSTGVRICARCRRCSAIPRCRPRNDMRMSRSNSSHRYRQAFPRA